MAQEHYFELFPFWTRRVSWRDVGGVEVRSFSPIREYGGWGIRYNLKRREWAYIVRGGRGVSLELDGGTRLLIGSQKPEALADAIRSAMAGSRSGL